MQIAALIIFGVILIGLSLILAFGGGKPNGDHHDSGFGGSA